MKARTTGSGQRVQHVLLTCSNDAGSGGVQVVFRDLVRAIEQSGRHVHLLYQSSIARPGLRQGFNGWGRQAFYCPMPTLLRRSVLSLPLTLAVLPLVMLQLARLVRRHRIDVINAHYLAEYFVHLALAARLLRVPLVVSVHGADIDRYATLRPFERLLLRLVMYAAHRIVACSRAMAAETARVFPAGRQKITYVHNGLLLGDLPAGRSSVPAMPPFVLSVCRQVAKKGVDTLLRAFVRVRRHVPNATLVIIGDGPELGKHRALAETLGIADQVQFLGDRPRAEVLSVLAACSVFVLPSRAEPFGLVLLEAAAYKRPIVCTAVGGVPEIITDGVTGCVVAPDDPDAMADRIRAVLTDPGLAARLGASAHETVVARFRWEDRVRDYLAVYDDTRRNAEPRACGEEPISPTVDTRSQA